MFVSGFVQLSIWSLQIDTLDSAGTHQQQNPVTPECLNMWPSVKALKKVYITRFTLSMTEIL